MQWQRYPSSSLPPELGLLRLGPVNLHVLKELYRWFWLRAKVKIPWPRRRALLRWWRFPLKRKFLYWARAPVRCIQKKVQKTHGWNHLIAHRVVELQYRSLEWNWLEQDWVLCFSIQKRHSKPILIEKAVVRNWHFIIIMNNSWSTQLKIVIKLVLCLNIMVPILHLFAN